MNNIELLSNFIYKNKIYSKCSEQEQKEIDKALYELEVFVENVIIGIDYAKGESISGYQPTKAMIIGKPPKGTDRKDA